MTRLLSLRDCVNFEAVELHPDPHVRIAALHHAGRRLCASGEEPGAMQRLRGQVGARLADRDGRVARYAAVTLAQIGDRRGVRWLLSATARATPAEGGPLMLALRDCTRFPFLVLLTKAIDPVILAAGLEGPGKAELERVLLWADDDFQKLGATNPAEQARVLESLTAINAMSGLERRAGVYCRRGVARSVPLEGPGSLFLPESGLSLLYHDEAVVNPDEACAGRDVLTVCRLAGLGQREARIRLMANEEWKLAGQPDGRADEFWRAAEGEFDAAREKEIAQRAYFLWERAGRPWGADFAESARREQEEHERGLCEVEAVYFFGAVPGGGARNEEEGARNEEGSTCPVR
jgi:hypothetical protein